MDALIPAAAYLRVSTEGQVEDGLSLESQLEEIQRFAARNGYEIVMSFCDAGKRGSDANREEFVRMRHLATSKTPPFKAIIAWKSNRIARSVEIAAAFRGLLKRHGIDLVFVAEPTVEGPIGALIASILDGVNEFYSGQLGEDTLRGMNAGAQRGIAQGGIAPYGFQKIVDAEGKRRFDPDTIEAERVREMYRLYAEGYGMNDIARKFNREGVVTRRGGKWSSVHVSYILFRHREYYLGNLVFNRERKDKRGRTLYEKPREEWIITPNAHTAIITPEMGAAVDDAKVGRFCIRSLMGPEEDRALLVGVLRCGHCGARMTANWAPSTRGKIRYYRCGQRAAARSNGHEEPFCMAQSIRCEVLDALVLEEIERNFSDVDAARATMRQEDGGAKRGEETARKRQELERRRNNLIGAIESGALGFGEAKTRLDAIREEMARLDAADLPPPSPREPVDMAALVESVKHRLESRTGLREMVRTLIESIHATRGDVRIEWR